MSIQQIDGGGRTVPLGIRGAVEVPSKGCGKTRRLFPAKNELPGGGRAT